MAGLRIRFPSGRRPLGRLDEGVQIMRDAWRDGRVSFEGKHYQVDGAIVAPKPLQPSGIPLWIAGGGEKVTLRIAAIRQCTNFTSEPDGFAQKSQILAEHCRGRNGLRRDRALGQRQRRSGQHRRGRRQRIGRVRDRLAGIAGEARPTR
jgi:alkanesulfonate monooxygenase SsuD/methylene tetrahydromethanopterin reductase-like flavin-dependent oxidoreductase (luciferase family)